MSFFFSPIKDKGSFAAPPGMNDENKSSQGYSQSNYPGQSYQSNFDPQPGFAPQPAYPPQSQPYGHVPAHMYAGSDTNPLEQPAVKGFEFTDESIRRGFIRKVYAILSVRQGKTNCNIFIRD